LVATEKLVTGLDSKEFDLALDIEIESTASAQNVASDLRDLYQMVVAPALTNCSGTRRLVVRELQNDGTIVNVVFGDMTVSDEGT
jgi:hypothetical protein